MDLVFRVERTGNRVMGDADSSSRLSIALPDLEPLIEPLSK